jgi:putative hydrolase of the HAD superfamily
MDQRPVTTIVVWAEMLMPAAQQNMSREDKVKIFFDVDGVLIDGWHAKPERRKRWDMTLERDLGVNPEAFQEKFFGLPTEKFPSLMHGCVRGECDLKEALATVLPTLGYDGPVDAFVTYWFANDANVNHNVLDVVRCLTRHAQVKLYLVTMQEHYRAAYLWNELGLRDYFIDIFYSAKLGQLKNTREFFDRINLLLGIVAGEHPLFFDDNEEIVGLARESGWDACVFDCVEDLHKHPRLRALLRE